MTTSPSIGAAHARAWEARAQAALSWRDGASIHPVLEALALSLAMDVLGLLGECSPRARDDLRRIGQRALLHVGGQRGDGDEEEEALRIAVVLARDGLRALAGRASDPPGRASDPPGGAVAPVSAPTAREMARLIEGTAEPLEAASIARRIRRSERAKAELAWALRVRSGVTEEVTVRLAAADGELMRDPAGGRRIATITDPTTGAALAEAFAFEGGIVAVYASSGGAVRLEGPSLRTETMQPGYWSGRFDGEEPMKGTLHLGERALPFFARL